MLRSIAAFSLIILSCLLLADVSSAQQKDEILKGEMRQSPKASVSQAIGFTSITVEYSRPGVKGRKVWGDLVPFKELWRTGANEATKITFSTDVWAGGKKLRAGAYSFFTIPSESEWTIIFNKDADQWGPFTYNEVEDALRIKVKPVSSSFREWLSFEFSDMKIQPTGKKNSAVLNLVWEKLKVPIKIEVDTK